MKEIRLTKDSDALICALYKSYCEKRAAGIGKSTAKATGSAARIQHEIVPKWRLEDVEETCWELSRAGMLSCLPADDTIFDSAISDAGIIYMENRFKDGLNTLLSHLETVKSILLW